MRQRLVALAAAATLAATAAAPAFADDSTSRVTPPTTLYTCNANASLTENGKVVYSVTRTFKSANNLTGNYSRTYTVGGNTFSVSASVTCTR